MVSITKLYLGADEAFDHIRYGLSPKERKPVVVWNITGRCNLNCRHCYAHSRKDTETHGELSTEEAKSVIEDLSRLGVPVILFSGGEPLLRKDIFELLDYAREKGLKTVLSTNGTLIIRDVAKILSSLSVSYVGISLDGLYEVNDLFRGKDGAFSEALRGILNCKNEGIKVGIRFTITKLNYEHIPKIFDFFDSYEIERICFYHLVYSGRGRSLMDLDISAEERRRILDLIIRRAKEIYEKRKIEVLTVDNHADGPYVYLKLLEEDLERAKKVLELLKTNSGNLSGLGIACIDEKGFVHPDQFLRDINLGNLRDVPFSKIWTDEKNEILSMLRRKRNYLKGRCSRCRFLDICGGNFRARAYAKYGDLWMEDPQCYLTDAEIS